MLKTYKYRIYPNDAQMEKIEQTIGTCRLVYNLGLQVKIDAWKNHQKKISSFDLCFQLIDLKNEFAWIRDVDSQALQASVKNIDTSFQNFFNGKGYPKFKRKRDGGSFQCPNNLRKIDFEKGLLTIPKIYNIPIRISKRFNGKIKTITISKTPTGKYFSCILVDTEDIQVSQKPITEMGAIGIDLGISSFAVLSSGEKIEGLNPIRNNIERLKVLQRRSDKKKSGSSNRLKAKKKTAKQHEIISNQRKDFLQKLSTRIVCDNQTDTICVESLAVKNMVRNHKLAKSIVDASWAEFVRQLEYKSKWYGKNLIKISRFAPSSKICCCCGCKYDNLRLSEREWKCNNCSIVHDRDVNAAINIKLIGLDNSGRGTSVEPVELPSIYGAQKQEYKQ